MPVNTLNKLGLSDKLASLPSVPGCYLFKDAQGTVIYVGKAVILRNRVRSYFQKGADHPPRTAQMVRAVRDLEWMATDTEVEALILESTLIKKLRPHFNVRLKDDKSYPYVCVTIKDPYPRVYFTRRPHLTPDGNLYFGPFTNARAIRDTLRVVRRLFGVQSCRQRFTGNEHLRPCLYYHLKQCLGPCTGDLDRRDYMRAIRQVCKVLEGKHEEIMGQVTAQMDQAAADMEFERAAILRDRLKALGALAERQKVFSVEQVDQDIIGIARDGAETIAHVFFVRAGRLVGQESFGMETPDSEDEAAIVEQFIKQYYRGAGAVPAEILVPAEPGDRETIEDWLSERRGRKARVLVPRRGEKKRMVDLVRKNADIALQQRMRRGLTDRARGLQSCIELGEALEMEVPPVRIECYDISNLQGSFAVASMVVFEDGLAAKKEYRHFRIRTVEGQDDFASMSEVIGRRLARTREGDGRFGELADLMIIDGGQGQLSAALAAVRESGEEGMSVVSIAKKEEEIYVPGRLEPIRLARRSSALQLVQRIRDEAHRFALSYHRKLRGKGSLRSELDGIPGIGPARRKLLIQTFGSLEEIRKLSPGELAGVPGMSQAAASALHARLHSGRKDEGHAGRD